MFEPAPSDRTVRETDEAYVFRDFERSRIVAIRQAVADDPAFYSFWYFAVVAIWTVLMSAGAGLHGQNLLAVNVTPHVAHFTITLGIFIYPLRLIWVPISAYFAVFLYPFYQPLTNSVPWHRIADMSGAIMLELFVINLLAGLTLGLLYRGAFELARPRLRAQATDLSLGIASYLLFALVGAAQIFVTAGFAQTLGEPLRAAMGFDANYIELAMLRTLRGSAVTAAFLLAAVEYPKREQAFATLGVILLFPLLAALQSQGFVLFPMIDAVILALALVFLLPVRIALFGVIGGIAVFAALTGEFLIDRLSNDPALVVLERYSVIALVILLIAIAVKSHTGHMIGQKDAAIRKLDRARFCGRRSFRWKPHDRPLPSGRCRAADALASRRRRYRSPARRAVGR